MMNSRFGVQLEGDEFDLVRLKKKVNGCIASTESRFIESFNSVTVLRYRGWDKLTLGMELQDIAQGHVDVLAASLRLLEGCGHISIGTLYELDGGNIVNMWRTTRLFEVREAFVEVPLEVFNEIMLATEKSTHFQSAVSVLGAEGTWYNVYASVESLARLYGGEKNMLRKFPSLDVMKMKRTANSYRHVKGSFDPIKSPMPIAEAVKLLRKMLCQVAHELTSVDSKIPIGQIAQSDRTFPDDVVTSFNRLSVAP